MGLFRWFTKNRANTREPTHADLGPLELALPVPEAVARVRQAVSRLSRWQLVGVADGLALTRRTRVIGYVDDIRLTFEPTPDGTRVHAESRSRVGTGDLGQNRRNILELWAALRNLTP